MGPDFLTLALTAIISSITGGGWIASKVLERHKERLKDSIQNVENQRMRINASVSYTHLTLPTKA